MTFSWTTKKPGTCRRLIATTTPLLFAGSFLAIGTCYLLCIGDVHGQKQDVKSEIVIDKYEGFSITRDRAQIGKVLRINVEENASLDNLVAYVREIKSIDTVVIWEHKELRRILTAVSKAKPHTLSFVACRLDDTVAEALAGIQDLSNLYLRECVLQEPSLQKLCGIPGLKLFSINKMKISDKNLDDLSRSKTIRIFQFMNCDLTQRNIRKILTYKNAQGIYFENEAFTDADVPAMVTLPNLKAVKLDGSKVTDAGLLELVSRVRLEFVSVRWTKVTDQAIERAKREYPGVTFQK